MTVVTIVNNRMEHWHARHAEASDYQKTGGKARQFKRSVLTKRQTRGKESSVMFDIAQRTLSSLLFLAILPSLALDHAYYNVPSLKYEKPSYASPFGNLGTDQAYDAPQLKDFGLTQTPGNHYCHPTAPYWIIFSLVTNLEDDKNSNSLQNV